MRNGSMLATCQGPVQLRLSMLDHAFISHRSRGHCKSCLMLQVVSIPFYIWNMLGTLPLRAAYLQQLLHICQAMQFQPTPYNSPTQPAAQSITDRTFSNSGIERINSALAAQWSKPSTAAAAAHAGPGLGNMTADAAAAAGRAASCSRGPMTAGAAMMHQQLADSSRQLPERVHNSALYQAYDRPSSTAAVPSHDLSLQSPFPQGFRHSSQIQSQAFQAGLQYSQDGRSAAAAAASCGDVSPSAWELGSNPSQSGAVHHQSRLFEADLSRSDSKQSRTDSGKSVHDGWAGQGQGMPGGDPPLGAAQYDAVAALQSLALQLQATGQYTASLVLELAVNAMGKTSPINSNPLIASGLLTFFVIGLHKLTAVVMQVTNWVAFALLCPCLSSKALLTANATITVQRMLQLLKSHQLLGTTMRSP